MRGVELSHHDGDCSFETILHHFGLDDPVLWDVAQVVHEADLADDRFDEPAARRARCDLSRADVRGRRRAGARGHRGDLRRALRATPPTAARRCATDRPTPRRVVAAQAARAFAYGLGAVLLGATLDERGFSSLAGRSRARRGARRHGRRFVGRSAGSAIAVGRRRCYRRAVRLPGGQRAWCSPSRSSVWLLVAVSLRRARCPPRSSSRGRSPRSNRRCWPASSSTGALARGFGVYNAVAAAAGSLGALAAAAIGPLRSVVARHRPTTSGSSCCWFPPRLVGHGARRGGSSDAVEQRRTAAEPVASRPLGDVASDRGALGRAVQPRLLRRRVHGAGVRRVLAGATLRRLGRRDRRDVLRRRCVADRVVPGSGRLADRFGMLPTMVFTHLPSNLVLIAVAFSPTLCRSPSACCCCARCCRRWTCPPARPT